MFKFIINKSCTTKRFLNHNDLTIVWIKTKLITFIHIHDVIPPLVLIVNKTIPNKCMQIKQITKFSIFYFILLYQANS